MEKLKQSVFTSVVSNVVHVLMSIIMPWHCILLNRMNRILSLIVLLFEQLVVSSNRQWSSGRVSMQKNQFYVF